MAGKQSQTYRHASVVEKTFHLLSKRPKMEANRVTCNLRPLLDLQIVSRSEQTESLFSRLREILQRHLPSHGLPDKPLIKSERKNNDPYST